MDGYFTNDKILQYAEKAMTILEKDYPEDDHVFVFDNAMAHLKRTDNALSAQNMPKTCKNWGVSAPVRDAIGKQTHGGDGKILMQKVYIANGVFNGVPQEFYFPGGHTNAGLFKGMAKILGERGFDVSKKKAQCKDFNCPHGSTSCCCHQILYNQPDFVNVESNLERECRLRGFKMLFLPKFHCKLSFIK